jgi:WS/DGAT/MGAT family acyltransferase
MAGSSRMSPTEAIMWAVDKDPALRSDYCNLTILDGVPDVRRLRAKLAAAIVELPRLAERVVAAPLRIVPPEWRPDPTFDLDYHLRRVALPGSGSMRELLDLASTLCTLPLDRSRPLWEFTLVEGLEGGRAALLQRVHHAIVDGVGGLRLSLTLVDLERDPVPLAVGTAQQLASNEDARRQREVLEDPIDRDSPADVLREAVRDAVQSGAGLVRNGAVAGADLVAHPAAIPARLADTAALLASLRRQLLVTDPARSQLMAERSLGRRFDVLRLPLDAAAEAAHRFGGSVNDLFVTGVCGALGLYHSGMGEPTEELRMAMPVNTRSGPADSAANRFAPTRVLVPLGPKDPRERFTAVHARLATIREEPALDAADALAALAAGAPTSILVTGARAQTRTVDFATSNLRGSPEVLYLGGAKILATYGIGPRAGCALNVTAVSYAGSLHLGLNSDPAAVTDPEALLSCFEESFDALLAAGISPQG